MELLPEVGAEVGSDLPLHKPTVYGTSSFHLYSRCNPTKAGRFRHEAATASGLKLVVGLCSGGLQIFLSERLFCKESRDLTGPERGYDLSRAQATINIQDGRAAQKGDTGFWKHPTTSCLDKKLRRNVSAD